MNPLDYACLHIATPQEQERDPDYLACNAQPGEPCRWAKRHDGVIDPPFHAERLEISTNAEEKLQTALDNETFREAILDTGLV